MAFRNELQAARERIEALDREVRDLQRERSAKQASEPPFAIAAVVLMLALLGACSGLVLLWTRAETAEARADYWRRTEGETAVELQETRQRLDAARRLEPAARPLDSSLDAVGRALAWESQSAREQRTGEVTERIGNAPAALGDRCTVSIAQLRVRRAPGEPQECAARVVCGEHDVYPAAYDTEVMGCSLGRERGRIVLSSPFEATTRRLTGDAESVRIDDGASGTWSIRIATDR